jgi:hypothetical protein
MTNNINVSLDTSTGANLLNVVDNGGQNQVNQNPNAATTISWNLTGVLTQGNFVPMTDAEPGFEWITAPPDDLFGTPEISANGNSLSITDDHVDATTSGEWIYLLRVDYDGAVVSTEATLPRGTVTNPVIINR